MRRELGPGEGQSGFAAVDALVAVTILAMSLGLSLTAAQAGVRATRVAAEIHDAELVLREQLEVTAGRVGAWSGKSRGLAWSVEASFADPAAATRGGVCTRVGTAKAGQRRYRLATVEACVPKVSTPATGAIGSRA